MNSVGLILNVDVTVTGLDGQAIKSVADVLLETSDNFGVYMQVGRKWNRLYIN